MQNGPQTINLYSIFRSINGEVCNPGQGSWATFVRLAGCNLNCYWCDTKYAQERVSGQMVEIESIVKEIHSLRCQNVTITGGEPMAQPDQLRELLELLLPHKYNISIETNGSYPVLDEFRNVSWVVDFKLPSSGESGKMGSREPWQQLYYKDYIKFVIADRIDYDIALSKVQQFWSEGVRAQMVFSPVLFTKETTFVNVLYKWMQENQLFSVLLNFQLHKLVKLKEPD